MPARRCWRWRPRWLALLVAASLAGCAKPAALPSDGGRAAPAPDLFAPTLSLALAEALERCRLTDFGGLADCEDQQQRKLATAEQASGTAASLRTYCLLLQKGMADRRAWLLATSRLNRLGTYPALQEVGQDEPLLSCLLDALPRQQEPLAARPLARAAAFLAGATGQHARLWSALEKSPPAAQAAAYGAVWATGRTRVLDRLAQLLRPEQPPALQKAVILGFARGQPLAAEEQEQVCQLLGGQAASTPVTTTACTAACTMIALCPKRRQELLELSATRLAQASALDACWLQALGRSVGRYGRSSSYSQQQHALQQLTAVYADEDRPEHVRELALETLWQLDRRAGSALARRLSRRGSAGLREKASALLRR